MGKKLLSLFIMFISLIFVAPVAADNEKISMDTLDEYSRSYIAYLKEKINQTNDLQERKRIGETKSKFIKLSPRKKHFFLNQLAEGKILKYMLKLEKAPENVDIVESVIEKEETPDDFISGSYTIYQTKITYTNSAKMFGITLLEFQAWVRYLRDGSEVLSVDGGNTYITKNFTANTIDWLKKDKWYNSEYACCENDCTVGIGLDFIDVDYASFHILVKGDAKGKGYGSLTPQ